MIYHEYNNCEHETTSEQRENRSRNTKCSIERRIPGCISKRLETRHSSQAVKCFRGANFNNAASREAQQRRPSPAPERFDTDVYSFLPFRPALPPSFRYHLSEHPPLYAPRIFNHYPRYSKCD